MAAISRQIASSHPSSRRSLDRSARERLAVAAPGATATGRTVDTALPPSTTAASSGSLRQAGGSAGRHGAAVSCGTASAGPAGQASAPGM
jgi:hypothetical protein